MLYIQVGLNRVHNVYIVQVERRGCPYRFRWGYPGRSTRTVYMYIGVLQEMAVVRVRIMQIIYSYVVIHVSPGMYVHLRSNAWEPMVWR